MGSRILAPTPPTHAPGDILIGQTVTHAVWPGQRLVATAGTHAHGHAWQIESNPGEAAPPVERIAIPAGRRTEIGPFSERRVFRVLSELGTLNVRVTGASR